MRITLEFCGRALVLLSRPRVMASSTSGNSNALVPLLSEIREKVQNVFGRRPCLWQSQVAQAVLKGEDVIVDVGTGMGKTLSFFIPPLFHPNGIQIIITALNVLGKQNEDVLRKAGISAVSISAKTATDAIFKV